MHRCCISGFCRCKYPRCSLRMGTPKASGPPFLDVDDRTRKLHPRGPVSCTDYLWSVGSLRMPAIWMCGPLVGPWAFRSCPTLLLMYVPVSVLPYSDFADGLPLGMQCELKTSVLCSPSIPRSRLCQVDLVRWQRFLHRFFGQR